MTSRAFKIKAPWAQPPADAEYQSVVLTTWYFEHKRHKCSPSRSKCSDAKCQIPAVTLRSMPPLPRVTRCQSSHSLAISIITLPITAAEAIKPCPSPSRTLTSHFRIVFPSHFTFSTGTLVSLLP